MKKHLALFMTMCLSAGLLFTACQGPYAASRSEEDDRTEVTELVLSDCFSENAGYHFPGYFWGDSFETFQQVTGGGVTDFISYLEDGGSLFIGDNVQLMLMGRVNDEAHVGVSEKDDVIFISVAFKDDAHKTPDEETLFNEYLQKLTDTFGEADEVTETVDSMETVRYKNKTYFWHYTLADGRKTALQFSSSVVAGATKPTYVMLGFSRDYEEE